MVKGCQYSVYVDLLRVRCLNHGDKLQEIYLLVDKNGRPQYFNHRYELDSVVRINRATHT